MGLKILVLVLVILFNGILFAYFDDRWKDTSFKTLKLMVLAFLVLLMLALIDSYTSYAGFSIFALIMMSLFAGMVNSFVPFFTAFFHFLFQFFDEDKAERPIFKWIRIIRLYFFFGLVTCYQVLCIVFAP